MPSMEVFLCEPNHIYARKIIKKHGKCQRLYRRVSLGCEQLPSPSFESRTSQTLVWSAATHITNGSISHTFFFRSLPHWRSVTQKWKSCFVNFSAILWHPPDVKLCSFAPCGCSSDTKFHRNSVHCHDSYNFNCK